MNTIQQNTRHLLATILIGWLTINSAVGSDAVPSNPGTRKSPDWLRSAVVYEIFPRNFSPEGISTRLPPDWMN